MSSTNFFTTFALKSRNLWFLCFLFGYILTSVSVNGNFPPRESFKIFKLLMGSPCVCSVQDEVTVCTKSDKTLYDFALETSCSILNSRQIKVKVNSSSDLTVVLKSLDNPTFIHRPLALMDLSSNNLDKIDFGLLFSFKNIFAFDLSHNQLTNFENTGNSLNSFRLLHALDISYNNITSVDFKNFGNIKFQLEILNLACNRVDKFLGHLSVSFLNLQYNDLENIAFDFFQNVSNVEELDLRYNNLYNIDYQALSNFTLLKYLKISYNNLNEIHYAVFHSLEELTNLELQFNNLSKIDSRQFEPLHNLKTLNISFNNLQIINHDTFHTLDKLESLDLSHNKITHFLDYTFILRDLKFLAINNNQIQSLNIDHILKFTKALETFHIDNNNWNCKNLSNIIEKCHSREITVKPREHYVENYPLGIVCNNISIFEHVKEDSLKSKSDRFYVYLGFGMVLVNLLWIPAIIKCRQRRRRRTVDEFELLVVS